MKHKTRTGFEPRTLRLTTGSVVTYLALLWFFTTGCLLGQLAKFKDIGFFARRHLSRRRLVLKRSARPFSRWHLWWRLVGGFVKMSFGRNVRLQESGRLKTWWHFNWDSSTKSPYSQPQLTLRWNLIILTGYFKSCDHCQPIRMIKCQRSINQGWKYFYCIGFRLWIIKDNSIKRIS